MKNCTTIFCLVFLLTSLITPSIHAAHFGGSNLEREYMIHAEDLGKWSAGVVGESRKRDLTGKGIIYEAKSNRVQGYLGYEVTKKITLYGAAGNYQNKLEGSKNSTDPIYSLGGQFNILHHEIPAPSLMENSIAINGTLQYSRSELKFGGESHEWEEVFASLTASIINDVHGNKLFWPDAVAVFVGPVFSNISSASLHEKQLGGFTAGVEFFFAHNVSVHVGIMNFDSYTYMGGAHINF